MINYEELELLTLTHQPIAPTQAYQPNLIHLDDPAESAIINFSSHPAITISPSESIDNAIFEMRSHDIHTILVLDNQHVIGILSSNDILGNKPIQLLQEKRINREQIQVHMIMSNINDSIFIDTKTLSFARVGNIVKTLKKHKKQYLLALDHDNKIYGLFTASRISKLLHKEL
jgi:CBS domain-containing protein